MRKTYFLLPYTIKFLLVNINGLYLKRKRYSGKFFRILNEYLAIDKNETMGLDIEKVKEISNESSFYSVTNKIDFFKSPIVTKEIVKENYQQIINKREVSTYLATGGTTGSGLKYPISQEFIYHQWAVYWKFRMIHGLDMNTWCAYIFAKSILNSNKKKPPYWIKDYFSKRLYLTLVHLNPSTVKSYLEQIKKTGIQWIHGYPSVINSLANLVNENNLTEFAHSLNIKCITTSSEMLLGYQRKNVESTFNCKVRQLYGMTEGVANIFECEHGSLHVDETYSFVEFIKDEDNPMLYKIVGTQYHNKAFPLIRYDTGDRVILDNDHELCKCGRKSRKVKEIIGRDTEYLLLKDGRKIVRVGMLFASAYNVNKAQIVQHTKGHAEFYIIKGSSYSQKDEDELIGSIIQLLGVDFKYDIIYTDTLRTTRSGKTRLIINETEIDRGLVDSPFNFVN